MRTRNIIRLLAVVAAVGGIATAGTVAAEAQSPNTDCAAHPYQNGTTVGHNDPVLLRYSPTCHTAWVHAESASSMNVWVENSTGASKSAKVVATSGGDDSYGWSGTTTWVSPTLPDTAQTKVRACASARAWNKTLCTEYH